jgi:glycosyltransferase involved in cell wall biosynthesis
MCDCEKWPRERNSWIVVPAYNEGCRLGNVIASLLKCGSNIVVVDDGSIDDTAAVALMHPVWLVRHLTNLGQGASLQTGIQFALQRGAEYVVTFDADGQHEPDDAIKLLTALAANKADFALGSRFAGGAPGIPWTRRLVLRVAVLFTRLFSGMAVTDTHNGIRAMTKRGAQQIHITMNRMEHASEILDQIARSGLPFVEVPVNIAYTDESLRKGQKSSAAFTIAIKLLLEKLRQ